MRHIPGVSIITHIQAIVSVLRTSPRDGAWLRPSLRQRRSLNVARRISVALLLGLAVAFALHGVTHNVQTRTVVVVARDIDRGQRLTIKDLNIREVPVTMAEGIFGTIGDALGKIAQIDMRQGTPMPISAATTMPVTPEGTTVLDIRMTGATNTIKQGDEVTLVAAKACADSPCESSSTIVVERALVMGAPRNDKVSTTTTLPCAIDHRQIPRLLAAQESSAIMAVSRSPTSY